MVNVKVLRAVIIIESIQLEIHGLIVAHGLLSFFNGADQSVKTLDGFLRFSLGQTGFIFLLCQEGLQLFVLSTQIIDFLNKGTNTIG